MIRAFTLPTLVLLLVATPLVAQEEADSDVEIVQTGEFTPRDLWFQARVRVNATCEAVYRQLTQVHRFQGLVPHLHGKAKVREVTESGDTVWYEFERADGSTGSGRFVVTDLVPNEKGQMIVLPDDGPWLRLQEMRLYPPEEGQKAKQCHAVYEETYNPRWIENVAYDMNAIVKDVREPYMRIILRRLKNMAEDKKPGPPKEVQTLRETAKHFP